MPVVSLLVASAAVALEQTLQLRYGPVGLVGAMLLVVGLKSGNVTVDRALTIARAPRGTLGLAACIAGRRRSHLREEWTAILAGEPENGRELSAVAQLGLALGFLLAALRMRIHDLAAPLWVPVDWLLSVESRSNTVIALLVGGQAVYIAGDGGLGALFSEIWEPCAIFGGALYVFFRWLRKVRGIELAAARGEESAPE
ncbi:hypothetical protein ACFXAS_05545 [Streptomyces sp. NPDC059459]|uniref:hypothetical protein n=1 Tax=Streptomyces sp. NPDC059459 TaxID=3346839 RepID=UPI0036CE546B